MTKVFYVAISNDEVVNGSIIVDSMCQADIEQYIVWDIENNYEDWYDMYITQLTELHVIVCGIDAQGYMIRLNGIQFDNDGTIIFNYIDRDEDSHEPIRYCM